MTTSTQPRASRSFVRTAPPPQGTLALLALAVLSIPFYRALTVQLGSVYLSVVDLLTMTAGLYLGAAFLSGRSLAWPRGVFSLGLATYVFAVAASGVGALDQVRAVHALLSVLLNVLLFTVTFQCLRSRRGLAVFRGSYCGACALLAAVALVQGLRMLEGGPLVSAAATLGSRNEMIYFLLPGFALAAGGAMGRGTQRFGYLLVAGLILAAVLVSRGRAGLLLCVLLGVLAPVLTSGSRRGLRVLEPLALWGLLGALGFALVSLSGTSELLDRYLTSLQTEFREHSGSTWARFEVLRGAWHAFTAHPLFGVGLDNFQLESGVWVDAGAQVGEHDFTAIQVHNTYLGTLAETGLAGFLGLCAMVAASLRGFGALRRASDADRSLYAGVFLALVSLLLYLAVFDGATRPGTWIFLAAVLALIELEPAPRHRPLVLRAGA